MTDNTVCAETVAKPTVLFVATTPFVVNPFLANHLLALSQEYRLVLCVNLDAYELTPKLKDVVEVHHIPFARQIAPLTDLKTLWQLTRLVRHLKPSLIHSITPKAGLLAMSAGFLGHVQHRWHTFTGQVWVTRRGLRRTLLKTMDRLIVALSTRVFADSASQCRLLEREAIVKPGSINMMGSGSIAGVDLQRFTPSPQNRNKMRNKLGTSEQACVFLFVGRLTTDKGLFDLLHAYRHLSMTQSQVELWVAGPDEAGLQQKLQAASHDIQGPIHWLGPTNCPEQWMSAADVLMLPSYREGFGTVVIEAAACGLPAIAYCIDGIIDAIEAGYSGLLVEFKNQDALSDAMAKLASDTTLRHQLGQQALQRVRSSFSSITVTQAWKDAYASFLKST